MHHSIPWSVTHLKRSRTFGFDMATYPSQLCRAKQLSLMQTHDRAINRGSTYRMQRIRVSTEDETGPRITKIIRQARSQSCVSTSPTLHAHMAEVNQHAGSCPTVLVFFLHSRFRFGASSYRDTRGWPGSGPLMLEATTTRLIGCQEIENA